MNVFGLSWRYLWSRPLATTLNLLLLALGLASMAFVLIAPTATDSAEDLRAVPAERLLNPMPAFYSDNLIVDGVVLTEDVVEAFAAGRQPDLATAPSGSGSCDSRPPRNIWSAWRSSFWLGQIPWGAI